MTESLLGIPHLVSALCYHLATADGEEEGYIGSRTRDALYRLYKDVAFSQLLGLREQLTFDFADGRDDSNATIKDEPFHGRVGDLERRLLSKSDSLNNRRCELLLPPGFGTIDDVKQTGFVCTEGERVLEFLRFLGGNAAGEEDEESGGAHSGAAEDNMFVLNRGLFVEEEPNLGRLPGDYVDGLDTSGPCALGWFVDQKKRRVTFRDIEMSRGMGDGGQHNAFLCHTSKSPVKVSIGSLFLDHSPGKMTSFEKLETKYEALYRDKGRGKKRLVQEEGLERIAPDVSLQPKSESLWSGEESKICREALLALYGVRASLAKLRGRLAMPEALPRPSTAKILSSIERSATCRGFIEQYINLNLRKETKDPITYAFANALRDVLHNVDRDLVEMEWSGSENWVQPMGMMASGVRGHTSIFKSEGVSRNGSFFDFEDPVIAQPEETNAHGGEFHGFGLSVLQLSHATSRVQSMLSFLSYLIDSCSDDGNMPSGCRLLEYIYEKSVSMEGDHAALAKRLLLGSFAPFISLMHTWAFGIRDLDEESPYTGPLSNEYVLGVPSYRRGIAANTISKSWISHIGPANIPNFLSEESKKALLVAGTQLRLLYSVSQEVDGVEDLAVLLGQVGIGMHRGMVFGDADHWFEIHEIGKDGSASSGNHERQENDPMMSGLVDVVGWNMSISASKHHVYDEWLQNLMRQRSSSKKTNDRNSVEKSHHTVSKSMLLNSSLPVSMLLETSVEDLLLIQASVVSKACTSLFIDYLNIFKAIEFTRQVFLGFAGDFLSEFIQALEPLVLSLEPISLHQAKSILFEASTISSVRSSEFSEYLRIHLLPGDNAVNHVQEAFSMDMQFSDAIRIKAPYYSAMAPVLIPPSGLDAYDCIYVSFEPRWPMGTIFSDDTLTAYAAVLNMNLRVSRALFALKALRSLTSHRDMIGKSIYITHDGFVWKSRLRVIHAFLFECLGHIDSISQMYKACCSGSSWDEVKSSLDPTSDSFERPETIHDIIYVHRNYIYEASRRISSCCNAPDISQAICRMLSTILDMRNLVEDRTRDMTGLEDLLAENDFWRQMKKLIATYHAQLEHIQKKKDQMPIAVTEEDQILENMLQKI